jgi:PST family polysaccharide transporter
VSVNEPPVTEEPEAASRDLRSLVVRGAGWMMASQVAIQVLALATSIVVARFLTPREVGLAAMALVFSSLAILMVDAGIGAVLVQKPELTDEDLDTAFWTNVALGVGLTLLGVGLSWPIAQLYGEPQVQPLFAVLSLTFLFTALGIVQGGLLTRELRFRSLEMRTIVATAISCAVGMALAILGAGPWAIVAQNLAISGVSTILLWLSSPWRPRPRFSRDRFRGMAGFGGHVLGTRTVTWGARNVDSLLIGRHLGAASLGAYSIAYNLMLTAVNRIASPVTQVFFPAFSRIRDRGRIAGLWLRAVRMVALIVVPSMLGLIAVAPDFVEVLFGRRWHQAAPVFQILAPIGVAQALQALNYGILQALAQTRILFRYMTVASIVTIVSFVVGLPWGIEGVATAYLAASVVLEPAYLKLTARAVGISPLDWVRSIAGVLEAGIAMLIVVFGVRKLLLGTEIPVSGRLALLILLGAALYVPLVAWRSPEAIAEIRALLERRGGGTAASTGA